MPQSVRTGGTNIAKAPKTRAADLYARLRADIIECRLQPAERLRFDETRERYATGLTPLREALMRLAQEGLVVLEDQRGFHVAPVSATDLLDVTRMRVELESMAVRWSIKNGDDQWEVGVVGTLHALSKRFKINAELIVNQEWERRHDAFHAALVSACGSEWLLCMRRMLYDRADRYRRLSIKYQQVVRDDVGEHRQLAEAALRRDADTAARLMREHIETTSRVIMSFTDPLSTPTRQTAERRLDNTSWIS